MAQRLLFCRRLSIFFGFPFLKRVKLPIPTDCAQEKKEPTRLFHLKGFKRFSLIFGCYALIEIGFSAWLVEFLKSFYNQSANEARYLLSLYFIALLCGRIIGSLYLDQLGYKISALIHLVLFLTFGSVLIFYSSHWSIVLTIGLSASVFFPIMTALASDQFLEKTQEALGFFYSIAGIGGIIALWGIGKFGEIFNLQLALVLILIAAFIMIICIGTLKSEPK